MNAPRWIAMIAVLAALAGPPSDAPAATPRVAVAWPAGPMEVRVAFAEAVDPAVTTRAVGAKVGFVDPAAAGRPGGNGGTLRVAAARLEDEGRTLVLITDPHPREATYTLSLAGVKAPGDSGNGATVEVRYDLSGVEATWAEGPNPEPDAPPNWSGWWPDLDAERARELTKGSAGHDKLWGMTARAGRLTLRAFVMLPQGEATLALDAGAPFEATLAGEEAKSVANPDGSHKAALKAEGTGEAVELTVALATGPGAAPRLRAAILAGDDAQGRPLPRSALVLPWAPPTPPTAAPPDVPQNLLAGGDPAKGEIAFRGDVAKCANCHAVRGQGAAIGPDLGYLAGADRAWVYQNIAEPSASIHPDYTSFTVALKDGRVAMGVVRAEGADALKVGDIDAKQTVIPRADVEELRPSTSSIMPVGLLGALGEQGTRDLLAFLTAPAPKSSARPELPR